MIPKVAALASLTPGHAMHLEYPDHHPPGEVRRMLALRATDDALDRAGELVAIDGWRMGIFVGEPRAAVVLVMLEALEHRWETVFDFHAPSLPQPGASLRQLAAQPLAHVLLVGHGGAVVRQGLRYEKGGAKLKRCAATAIQKLEKRPAWTPDDFGAALASLLDERYPSLNRRWDALEDARAGSDWILLR